MSTMLIFAKSVQRKKLTTHSTLADEREDLFIQQIMFSLHCWKL